MRCAAVKVSPYHVLGVLVFRSDAGMLDSGRLIEWNGKSSHWLLAAQWQYMQIDVRGSPLLRYAWRVD